MSSSYIELTIPGPGISRVFFDNIGDIYNSWCPSPTSFPDEIYINDIKQANINSSYYFNNSINIVKLVFSNNLQNMTCMFYLCYNITTIDFSHFDNYPNFFENEKKVFFVIFKDLGYIISLYFTLLLFLMFNF